MKYIIFKIIKTKRSFGREIYSGILTLDDALELVKFKESVKQKIPHKKKKTLTF